MKSIIENGDTQGNKGGSISSEIKFARTAIKALDKHKPDDFTRAIVEEQGNVHMTFAYLNRLETFIRDAKSSLEGIYDSFVSAVAVKPFNLCL